MKKVLTISMLSIAAATGVSLSAANHAAPPAYGEVFPDASKIAVGYQALQAIINPTSSAEPAPGQGFRIISAQPASTTMQTQRRSTYEPSGCQRCMDGCERWTQCACVTCACAPIALCCPTIGGGAIYAFTMRAALGTGDSNS